MPLQTVEAAGKPQYVSLSRLKVKFHSKISNGITNFCAGEQWMQFITALLLVEADHGGNQNSFGPIAG